MIILDTNFLINGVTDGSREHEKLREWITVRETLRINVIIWAEFLCGPVTTDDVLAASRLLPGPEPLLAEDAVRGAAFFNGTGRRRRALADCLIAATCVRLNATIATNNVGDFEFFGPLGVRVFRFD